MFGSCLFRILVAGVLSAALLSSSGCDKTLEPNKDKATDSGKEATTTPDGSTSPPTGTNVTSAAAGAVDVTYVTEDFVGAVIARPKQFLESALLSGLPQDEILQRLMPTDEINPHTVEQFTALLAPFPEGAAAQLVVPPVTRDFSPEELERSKFPRARTGEDEPASDAEPGFPEPELDAEPGFGEAPHESESAGFKRPTNFGFIVRFTDAAAAAKSIVKFTSRGTAVGYEGLTYYKGTTWCAYLDDRTVVVSSEELLKKMITSKGAQSPLIDRLSQADGKADLVAVVIVEPLRELANQAAKTLTKVARPS